jgi:Domain of unknown function (DUF4349)
MSAMRRFGVVPAAVIVVSGLVGAAAGCSGGSASGGQGGGSGGATVAHAPAANGGLAFDSLGTADKGVSASPRGAAEPAKVPLQALKLTALPSSVIKTGDIALRIDHGRFGQAVRAVRGIAARLGGDEVRTSTTGTRIHSGRMTIRVPARSFPRAMDAIEAIAHVHITSRSVTGQDVSQQFVDLRARLVNLEAQEKVLLRLMDRATTIAESIRVENYLQNVEFQIEDVQGRILYLENRTSMSTITVVLHEAGKKPAPPQHASAIWKAGERSLDAALAVVTSVIVGAGLVIPISILALLALLVGRRLAPLAPQLRARSATGPSASNEG